MKKILSILLLLGITIGVSGQDLYNKKYSLGQNSGGNWYKLFEVDLNGSGDFNSVNISVDFHYVNTWIKYNSSAIIRLREGVGMSSSDWQDNVIGLKQSVLKFKKIGPKVYELWGYSNGGWGHFSFECTVTKEADLIINIPSTPFLISDINLGEDVLTKGEWYSSSGDFIINNGKVGIGTSSPDMKLTVNGKIHAKEVKVDLIGWPDYVFEKDYNLPSLTEVEEHIKNKGRLINIPSAEEVEKNGIQLGEMNKLLLEKIEELTLYVLELKKENEQIKKLIKVKQ